MNASPACSRSPSVNKLMVARSLRQASVDDRRPESTIAIGFNDCGVFFEGRRLFTLPFGFSVLRSSFIVHRFNGHRLVVVQARQSVS